MDLQDQARASHAVDITSLVREFREELAASSSSAQLPGGSLPCPIKIAWVSGLARDVKSMEYEPRHVAIGPLHMDRWPKLAMDEEKKRSFRAVLLLASFGTTEEKYLKAMVPLERQARSAYGRVIDGMSSTTFARMLLLDACYLLVQFGEIGKYVDGRRRSDGVTATAEEGHAQDGSAAGRADRPKDIDVVRDVLFLAENQIPFFVIDKIHQLTVLDAGESAADMMAQEVRKILRKNQYSRAMPNVEEPPGPGNLLHLMHMHFKRTAPPSSTGMADTGEPVGRCRNAMEYHFSGVKFKKRTLGEDECQSILDVRLVNGGSTLEIPYLIIDNETWAILRNLIALEQENNETTGSDVTAYCVFLCQLACQASDVEFLSRRGIISHECGNDGEVAGFFSNLCKGIKFDKDDDNLNYLKATHQALEKRFQRRWLRWMVLLRQRYFENPWLTLGLAAAAVGLACAVVQAVYSVLGYAHH